MIKLSKFEESNFYKSLQDFFINSNKETFLQFLAEFYNRTEEIINKNDNQYELIKELRELYLEFNEKGIDDNIVREKVNYFIENNGKLKDIIPKVNTNTNNIKNINSKLDNIEIEKANVNFVREEITKAQLQGASVNTSNFVVKSELTSCLYDVQNVMYNDYKVGTELNWVNQHLSKTDGSGVSSTIGIRCTNLPANMSLLLLVTNASNYIFRIAEYRSDWTFVKMLVTDERVDRFIFDKDKYYRLSVFKTDKTDLSDAERDLIKKSIKIKKLRRSDDELLNEITVSNLTYTGLSPYLLNRLSYTPFCNSYKPKIAFVDDDGFETVLTTTIPLFESKNLPLTTACWATSQVFDNPTNKANLIAKLGDKLEIAQHTANEMTGKTEKELRTYFDKQMNFWNTNSINVSSMVYGYNAHDTMLRCVVSDYFKLACQGSDATLSNNINRYALNRIRVRTATNLPTYKKHVDKAIANKESLIFFWHSNELSDNTDLYNCLSDLLDYVNTKSGLITPVTLSNLI